MILDMDQPALVNGVIEFPVIAFSDKPNANIVETPVVVASTPGGVTIYIGASVSDLGQPPEL